MKNEKDLSLFTTRTDLIDDLSLNINEDTYEENDVKVTSIFIDDDNSKIIDKKSGYYTTISFKDTTDHTNFSNVKTIFIKELNKMLNKEKIEKDSTCLIIGLGNSESTPDSLGIKTSENIIITKHIYNIFGTLEKGYRITSRFNPGVMGETGIETSDVITSIVNLVNPDFVIVIDALASLSIDRVCKTIQITNAGISPGSGIGNKRKEISYDSINKPVIAIGVPMVVDAATIVSDTITYMEKHFSYNIKNKDDKKNKLIPLSKINYLKEKDLKLTSEEKNYFFGKLGTLDDYEKRSLIFDVLTPIGYNLMVTPKEVDFLVESLSKLLSEGINSCLHNI